jgi:SAM-dependent methyltransferase
MKTNSTATVLTTGNAAKLYCLKWIEQRIQTENALTILDLGCGTAQNFVRLLNRYPHVKYVGIEPSKDACDAARRNLTSHDAIIIQAYAYNAFQLVHDHFDVVVSFSVLEHVLQRQRYLSSVRHCLKAEGHCLINYDAGHFVAPQGIKERLKNSIGPFLAHIGMEAYYQRFVKEDEFLAMVKRADLEIVESKFFNTRLKGIHKHIPPQYQDEHMERWLGYELWLNELGITYRDHLARTWMTRNFVLRRRG